MSEPAKRSFVVCVYAVLVLGTLSVFWQAGNFDFVHYDDKDYVFENPHVLGGLTHDGIVWAFTTGHASNWHPLTWLSHMLDCRLFGARPGPMHLVNVFLHIANVLLLFAVLKGMTGHLWPSAFVAAAFALHPMHVESVAWIAERKDVLSTLFLLLTLAAYVGYVRRRGTAWYLLTVLLFALGLMAKPMLVTLPFLLLLLDYWPLNRFDARSLKEGARATAGRMVLEKIPFFVLAAASGVVTFLVQRAIGAVADFTMLPLHSRIANVFLSYVKYIGKMFWPLDMAVFYPFERGGIPFWQAASCALLLLVISVLVIRLGRRRKYLPVGWFWFIGTLVPVIGLVQVGGQGFADRYTYIPYTGIFIMIAWGLPELLSRVPRRKLILGLLMAAVLTTLGICAHRQVSYWKDSITLFSHAIEVTKDNDVAHHTRGLVYGKLGRWPEAMADFGEAIRTRPDHAEAYNNRGVAYTMFDRGPEAMADFREAVRLKPDFAKAYYNLGVACDNLGRYQDAADAYKQAISIKQDFAQARDSLARLIAAHPQLRP